VGSTSGWLEAMAADTAASKERKGSCILLWMTGGPSQTDTPGTLDERFGRRRVYADLSG
jgi:hypothetical protein